MDRQTLGIGILTLTAALLLGANYWLSPTATAQVATSDRDFQLIAGPVQDPPGGDAVYVIDNRAGLVAVFAYDRTARALTPRVVRPVSDAFVDFVEP